jgi:adenosylcobinamide-phosphate synthase
MPHLLPLTVLLALMLDAMLGYPAALHARVPHPVVAIGKFIGALEARWNKSQYSFSLRRMLGIATLLSVAGCLAALGWLLQFAAGTSVGGTLFIAAVGSIFIAQRSLYQHVRAVEAPLQAGDIDAARRSVSHIVGRDTGCLDEAGIAAAAIESLAESFNDGVIAPAFWMVVGGLPGLFAYKAINTMDSMIGHKDARHRAFGWAAARADDLLNLIPARLAGLLLTGVRGAGVQTMWKDAAKHDSPNAGWPEAAMAGALHIRLGGEATYEGIVHARAIFGEGPRPTTRDLRRALRLYVGACAALWLLVALLGVLWRH